MPLTKITTDNIDFSSNLVFSNVTSMNVTTLNAGDALITGNLTVTGTTVTVNTNILDVKDLNITVAKGAGSSALSNGAGLTVDFPNAQFFYTSSDDSWNINKAFKTTNNVTIGTSAYFVANGNVGIGTSSPSYKLDIVDSTTANYYAGRFISTANSTGTSVTRVRIEKGTGYGGTVGGYIAQGIGSGLIFSTLNGGTLSDAMWINNSGNVGVGTNSPSSKLEVNGGIKTVGLEISNNIFLVSSSTVFQYARFLTDHVAIYKKTSNTYGYYFRSSDDGGEGGANGKNILELYNDKIVVFTDNIERLRVVANGNVGIGTSSPSQKLEVNGIVKATSFEGGGAIPSGTSMLFVQTTAPTGWTKSTTHDNKALRIVNGTAGSGGSVAFTSAFASQGVSGSINSVTVTGTVGATTLSTSQIPAHRHGYDGLLINNTNAFIINDGGGDNMAIADNAIDGVNGAYPKNLSIGGSGSHDHSFSGGSHSHTFTGTSINLAVQYVDAIIATKD